MRPCRACLWVMVLALAGCGRGHEDPESGSGVVAEEDAPATPQPLVNAGMSVEQFRKEPSVLNLLAVLETSHETMRERLGPHRLRYAAHLELQPTESVGRPKVGEVVSARQIVDDQLALDWGVGSDGEQTFHLRQGPPPRADAEHPAPGREMILIGETAYAMISPRGWLERPTESEVYELWLDDALHSSRDAVAMAAPRLELRSIEAHSEGDRPATRIALALASSQSRDASVIPNRLGSEWRHAAEISSLSGELVLDDESSACLRIELHLEWTMDDAESRPLRGVLDIEGTLVPDSSVTIEAPLTSAPLPERKRLQLERDRLLDGLAGR